MKNIIVFFCAITIWGCRNEEYVYISIEQKNALLYTLTENDTISLVKNNSDSIDFVITEKERWLVKERPMYGPTYYYEFYNLKAMSAKNSRIRIESYCAERDKFYFEFSIEGKIILNYIESFFESIKFEGIMYNNVYLLKNYTSSKDSCYTSVQYGIIKAWNDTVVYRRVQ